MEGERGAGSDDEGGIESVKKGDELLGIQLRKGISIGKRGGPFTPVPSWKMEPAAGPSSSSSLKKTIKPSARKLGASLWEAQELLTPSNPRMSRSRSKARPFHLSDASVPNSPLQAQIASKLTRHMGASSDQPPTATERDSGYLQPESPASYNSSLEVSSLNQAISSASDFNARFGESGYSVKTSAELIKVLNRIWSLEEQLASSLSLVKTLKVELHNAHSRIQKLVQDQESYRYEMDDLMKRVSEDRLTRKNKERDRIKAAVESVRNEVEEEKKLRRRSESLRHHLSKELSEVNSAFNETLNDLDRERKARGLLSELCDEFAKGIQEHEQEIWNQTQMFGQDCNHGFDQSLTRISKVWLDKQLQVKMADANGEEAEKNEILERLMVEITKFIQTRKLCHSGDNNTCQKGEKDGVLRRHSLESVHLNGAVGAPQDVEDDDSVVSDLHCFELNMDVKDTVSQTHLTDNHGGGMEWLKGKSKASLRNGKLKHPEQVDGHDACTIKQDRKESCDGGRMHPIRSSRENFSHTGTGEYKIHLDNDHIDSCNHFLISSHVDPIGKNAASGSGDRFLATLVAQQNYRNTSFNLDMSKGSSNPPRTVKENSLKEKLLEARLEGKNARLKSLKGSVGGP